MRLFMKTVPKMWGHEEWLVNEDEYCGKLLYVMKGKMCSMHSHPKKKETFVVLSGQVRMEVDGGLDTLSPGDIVTILPNEFHRFAGITDVKLLEISTHHDDDDVVRLTESGDVPQ